MSEWQPMNTEPRDGNFRLYGLTVVNRRVGLRWFEVYYLSLEDSGDLVETSGDPFTAWSHDDFEVWAPAPAPLHSYETIPRETAEKG